MASSANAATCPAGATSGGFIETQSPPASSDCFAFGKSHSTIPAALSGYELVDGSGSGDDPFEGALSFSLQPQISSNPKAYGPGNYWLTNVVNEDNESLSSQYTKFALVIKDGNICCDNLQWGAFAILASNIVINPIGDPTPDKYTWAIWKDAQGGDIKGLSGIELWGCTVDCPPPGVEEPGPVPIPPAIALFGSALFCMGVLGMRRRRKGRSF
jgi:hypothetical protein